MTLANIDPYARLRDSGAACRAHPDLDWFPEYADDITDQQAVCAACPVRDLCAELGERETAGIWGGVLRHRKIARRPRGTNKKTGRQYGDLLQQLADGGWHRRDRVIEQVADSPTVPARQRVTVRISWAIREHILEQQRLDDGHLWIRISDG